MISKQISRFGGSLFSKIARNAAAKISCRTHPIEFVAPSYPGEAVPNEKRDFSSHLVGRVLPALPTRRLSSFIIFPIAFYAVTGIGQVHAAITANKSFSPALISEFGRSTLTITLINPAGAPATAATVTDTFPVGVVVASPSNLTTTCGGTAVAAPGDVSVSLSGGTVPASGNCAVSVDVTSSASGNYLNTIPANTVSSSQGSNAQASSATLTVNPVSPVQITAQLDNGIGYVAGSSATSITYTLANPNAFQLTNAGLPLSLPSPITIGSPSNVSTTCGGGVVSGASGGASVTLSSATIPASGNCTITFNVTAPISVQIGNAFAPGQSIQNIAAGVITDDQAVSNAAAKVVYSLETGVQVVKSFSPSTVVSGQNSTLTISLTNLDAVNQQVDLLDSLPSGMVVAATPNASSTCGGTLTATPGASSISIAGGSMPANTVSAGYPVCTITVTVTGSNPGASNIVSTNSIPAGSFPSNGAAYSSASAALTIQPYTAIQVSKTISSRDSYGCSNSNAGYPGGACTATITLTNTSGVAESITSVKDDLMTMGTGFTVTDLTIGIGTPTSPPATTCGGALSAPIGGTLVTLSGGTLAVGATCTITFNILISPTASSGVYTNTIPAGAVTTDQGSNTTAASAIINVGINNLAVQKGASSTVLEVGSTFSYTLVLFSYSNVYPMTNLSLTDVLPAPIVVAANPNLTNTCGGTVAAVTGSGTITLSGGSLGLETNCHVTFNATIPANASAGAYTNAISQSQFQAEIAGVAANSNGQSASATVNAVNTQATVAKSFSPANIPTGGTSTMTIALSNTGNGATGNPFPLTNVALTDALPAGMIVANPADALVSGTGCSGTVAAVPNAKSVVISGLAIPADSTCSIQVNVTTASAVGNFVNTIPAGAITDDQQVSNTSGATATLAVPGVANLAITKTDNLGGATLQAGGNVTYTLTVSNAGPNNVSGVAVADNPPAGLSITGWTCASTGPGAVCGSASGGSGPLSDSATLNTTDQLIYTVTATLSNSYTNPSVTNSATVSPPAGIVTDPNLANNTASDTATVSPSTISLSVCKDNVDNGGSLKPIWGWNSRFTVVVDGGAPFIDSVGVGVNSLGCVGPISVPYSATSVTITEDQVSSTPTALPYHPTGYPRWYLGSDPGSNTGYEAATTKGVLTNVNATTDDVTFTIAQLIAAGSDATVFINNQAAPTFTLAKISQGGAGTFTFGGITNTANTTDTITTTAASTRQVSTLTSPVTSLNADVTVAESVPSGWFASPSSGACTDANSATTGNPASFGTISSAGALDVPAVNVLPGAAITCTYTNALITVVKTLKSVNGNPASSSTVINPGDTLVYTLTYANSGASAGTSVAYEVVPQNTTLTAVGATGSTACTLPAVAGTACPINTATGVPANGTTAVDLTMIATDPLPAGTTSIANFATTVLPLGCTAGQLGCVPPPCAPPGVAPNTCTNNSVATPNVTVAKSVDSSTPTPISANQAAVFDLTVTNTVTGTTAPAGYTFYEVVPQNTTFTSITNGTTDCSLPAAAGILCTITVTNPIVAGAPQVLKLTFTTASLLTAGMTSIFNIATQNATPPAGCATPGAVCTTPPTACPATDATCASVSTSTAAVTIVKTAVTAGPVGAGAAVVFNLTATNTVAGTTAAAGYQFLEVVPQQTTFTSISNGTTSCTLPAAAGTLCTITVTNPIVAGTPQAVTVRFTTNSPLAAGTTSIFNVATQNTTPPTGCTASGAVCTMPPTACPATNATCASVSTSTAALMVVKSVDAATPTPIGPNQSAVFDLTVTNTTTGTTAPVGYTFFEVVPQNTTFTSISNGTTDCALPAAAGTLCAITVTNLIVAGTPQIVKATFTTASPLPVGATSIFNVATQNTTAPPAGCTETNTVCTTPPTICPATNATCASVPTAQADMQATGRTSVLGTIGTPVTVTTTCTNGGPNGAVNATCTVTGAPAGATTTCTPATPVATLAVGSSITCTTTFTPSSATPVVIATTADSDMPDSNPSNNTATTTISSGQITPTPDSGTTSFNTPVTINVTANDAAVGSTINPASVVPTQPVHGAVSCDKLGNCTYTPNAGFTGVDTYTYTVCDNSGPPPRCGSTTVTVAVGPKANDDTVSTLQGSAVSGNVSGNDVYPPGSTFVVATAPGHGTVTMNPDGSYMYTPGDGYSGTDSFTYMVCEPAPYRALCSTATVRVAVTPPTQPPPANVVPTPMGEVARWMLLLMLGGIGCVAVERRRR